MPPCDDELWPTFTSFFQSVFPTADFIASAEVLLDFGFETGDVLTELEVLPIPL